MTVEEVTKAKENLEERISASIVAALDEFQVETGLSPDDISITFQRLERFGLLDKLVCTSVRAMIII